VSATVAWTFLVLVVLALAAASVWRRRTPPAPPPRPPAPLPRADDLGTLGLSPARPVGAPAMPTSAAASPAVPAPPADDAGPEEDEPGWTYDTGHAATPAGTPATDEAPLDTPAEVAGDEIADEAPTNDTPLGDGVATARPTLASPLTAPAAPSFVAPDSPLWVTPGPPEHLLASLAACIGGTVAVLRRAADGYHVDALAGLPTGAAPAPLAADGAHPLDRAPLDRVLSILDGDDLAALTYLPDGSARTALVRALDETSEPRVLVAVTLGVEADHVDADTARLIGDYVNLLAALRADDAPAAPDEDEDLDAEPLTDAALEDNDAAPDAGDAPEVADDVVDDGDASEPTDDAAPEAPGGETTGDASDPADGHPVVEVASPREAAPRRAPDALPRSVILAGEIAAARAARRPLAFALVTRADAEALLDDTGDGAARAEAELAALLRAAPRVRRVESFGPLLLAAFLDAEPDQVPVWARSLGGPPLHVGAVAPAAGDPEAVRRAAARALERAYAQGAVCLLAD